MTPEEAIGAAAGLGPYFAWQPRDDDPAWRPLTDLHDPAVVAERVETARRTLMRMSGLGAGDLPARVVASITFLGLAARLLSPPLAAAAVAGVPVTPDAGRLWWRPVDGGPIPVAYDTLGDRGSGLDLVLPILAVFQRRYTLSAHVLTGNVASALGGAAGMIADAAPAYAARAAALVEEMLAAPPLRDTATLVRPDPDRERWFLVRRNCCLYYRIPGGGYCGDCVLTPEDERRRQWRSVLTRGN